jgi:benzoyl-CoA reductase subunit C
LSGRPYSSEKLAAAITLYNENRALVVRLHEARAATPEKVSTYESYLVQRAGHLLPVEHHNTLLREYLELAGQRQAGEMDNARIVIVGAFCEQPPLGLIRSLELAGCSVVEDDLLMGNRLVGQVGSEGDPMEELATAYLHPRIPCSSVYDENSDRSAALVARTRSLRADGVVFASPSFCDPALLDRPIYQKALEDAGIPFTTLKYAENTRQLGAIREQVGTFAESIRLWGDAPVSPAA